MAEQKHWPLWKTPRDPRMVGTNWLIDGLKFALSAGESTFWDFHMEVSLQGCPGEGQ